MTTDRPVARRMNRTAVSMASVPFSEMSTRVRLRGATVEQTLRRACAIIGFVIAWLSSLPKVEQLLAHGVDDVGSTGAEGNRCRGARQVDEDIAIDVFDEPTLLARCHDGVGAMSQPGIEHLALARCEQLDSSAPEQVR